MPIESQGLKISSAPYGLFDKPKNFLHCGASPHLISQGPRHGNATGPREGLDIMDQWTRLTDGVYPQIKGFLFTSSWKIHMGVSWNRGTPKSSILV